MTKKAKIFSTQELSKILSRLEKRGFVESGETYFEAIKEEILKREEQKIQKLKKELNRLSENKFKTKEEFLDFLDQLLAA